MRTEDELRRAVGRQIEDDADVDVQGARHRVGSRVRRARALRAGAAALAVVAVVGAGAMVVERGDSAPVRVLPAERVVRPRGPLTPEMLACAGQARAIAGGVDAGIRWLVADAGEDFAIQWGDASEPGCGRSGTRLAKGGEPIWFGGAGGGSATNAAGMPNWRFLGGVVTKKATAVEVLYRSGERRLVDVIDTGPAGVNVYLLFADDELSPGPVLRDSIARVTAVRGTERIAHSDNHPRVPTLACTKGERAEWRYAGMDAEHPGEGLFVSDSPDGVVRLAAAELYKPGDRIESEVLIRVVRSNDRVVGLFSLIPNQSTMWGLSWNVRCVPR